jgi:hypothetical protein
VIADGGDDVVGLSDEVSDRDHDPVADRHAGSNPAGGETASGCLDSNGPPRRIKRSWSGLPGTCGGAGAAGGGDDHNHRRSHTENFSHSAYVRIPPLSSAPENRLL